MPYIIMKRDDIPDGTLQVLDMEPNTSLRNYTLDAPGQTKYVNAVENDSVVTTGAGPISLHRESRGLAAWFITNIDDGGGAALTAVEAEANAAAVLALYGYGDLTSAAGTLTLADINGALAAGSVAAAQYEDVMSLLAGRKYVAPRGVQVDSDGATFDVQPAVGAAGGPGFVANSNRELFANDGLPLSFAAGELSQYTSADFVYGGVAGNPNGEAVVVYNDDGTLYTP